MSRPDNHPAPEAVVSDIRQHVGYFELNPYLQLGDEDSGHGVLFGAMPQHGDVAVKPFYGKRGKANIEARNLERVKDLGFDAFQPLEVATGALAAYLITQRRPGIQHLGQVDWAADVASPRIRRILTPTLDTAATTAASWHTAGVTHGDMQIKNMMYDRSGSSVYGDAERTQVNLPPEALTQLAHRDLTMLGFSVNERGFLRDRSPRYRAGFLAESFVDPYLAATNPGEYVMDAESRKQAVVDWWTLAFRIGELPKRALPGITNHPKAA